MKKPIILLFLFMLLPSVWGITSGTNYSVGSSVYSLQGGDINGSIYDGVNYLTTNIGGSANGSIYSAVIGFFGKFKEASAPLPTLILTSPTNGIYLDKSIFLNYSATNADSVWYNLDSEENVTLTNPIYFFANNGDHILYVYANNSAGKIIYKNLTFSVNKDKFKIKSEKYKTDKKGSSTNLSIASYEELQNLSNLIIEDTSKGKIKFNQNVNLTDTANPGDNEIDLDTFTNISFNWIEINSTALPNLNKPATLQFYNLSFTNPRILRNGAICDSSICTEQSYVGGILTFNVTGFSVYSSEETPAEIPLPTPPTSGGGTGGAIMTSEIENFNVSVKEIKISITPGSIITKKINLTNEGNKKIKLKLKEDGLSDFIIFKENEIELNPYESKELVFDIAVREDVIPNLYVGKFIISGENKEEEIPIILEVESKGALFDVSVNIPEEYLKINPGSRLLVEIGLFNLGEIKRADVEMEYILEDEEGNEISTEKETIAVETRAGFVKRIKIPENLEYGKYILYVKVIYEGKIASATAEFNVTKPSWKFAIQIVLTILIGIVMFICLFKILKAIIKKCKKAHRPNNKSKHIFKKIIRKIKMYLGYMIESIK